MRWWQRSPHAYANEYHDKFSGWNVVEETGDKYAIEPATNMWSNPLYLGDVSLVV